MPRVGNKYNRYGTATEKEFRREFMNRWGTLGLESFQLPPGASKAFDGTEEVDVARLRSHEARAYGQRQSQSAVQRADEQPRNRKDDRRDGEGGAAGAAAQRAANHVAEHGPDARHHVRQHCERPLQHSAVGVKTQPDEKRRLQAVVLTRNICMPSHVSSQPPNRSSHFVALLSSCSWKSISSAVLLPAIAEGNGE